MRLADGTKAKFAPGIRGGLFAQAGALVPSRRVLDLNRLIEASPFRSILSRRWSPLISAVCEVPTEKPLSIPEFVINGIREELNAGSAILLLATNRSTRNKVEAALIAILLGPVAGQT